MDRRGFLTNAFTLTGGSAVLVGSGGCVGRIGTGDASIDRRERPERPEPLTESAVVEYVADLEAIRTHNMQVEHGATEVDVTTTATFDYEAADGYHVTAQHAGTVYHDENGERSVGELYSRPIPYRVTDDETIRLSIDREPARTIATDGEGSDPDGEGSDDEPVDAPLGVRLCNVLDRPREVALEVTRHEATVESATATLDGPTLLEETVTIGPERAVELREIGGDPGTYRVVARVSEDGLTGEGRIDIDLPGIDRSSNADVLSSHSGLATRALPAFDPI